MRRCLFVLTVSVCVCAKWKSTRWIQQAGDLPTFSAKNPGFRHGERLGGCPVWRPPVPPSLPAPLCVDCYAKTRAARRAHDRAAPAVPSACGIAAVWADWFCAPCAIPAPTPTVPQSRRPVAKKPTKTYERPGLSEEEIEEIREAFNLFDTDGSGMRAGP